MRPRKIFFVLASLGSRPTSFQQVDPSLDLEARRTRTVKDKTSVILLSRGMQAKKQDFSRIMIRPAGRVGSFQKLLGRLGSCQEVLDISRVASGGVGSLEVV